MLGHDLRGSITIAAHIIGEARLNVGFLTACRIVQLVVIVAFLLDRIGSRRCGCQDTCRSYGLSYARLAALPLLLLVVPVHVGEMRIDWMSHHY